MAAPAVTGVVIDVQGWTIFRWPVIEASSLPAEDLLLRTTPDGAEVFVSIHPEGPIRDLEF